MGESLFNFVLTDFDGIPSLPMFIGNYLLDLLSEFFPVLAILSAIVMIYQSVVQGGQDWKSTMRTIAPNGVSLMAIIAILNMNTPMKDSVGSEYKGAFEGVNSYAIVEIMNAFLGFGNIFADSLTHKIIYGTTDVTNGQEAIPNGYFPTVMKSLLDKKTARTEENDRIIANWKKETDILNKTLLGENSGNYKIDNKDFSFMIEYMNVGIINELNQLNEKGNKLSKVDAKMVQNRGVGANQGTMVRESAGNILVIGNQEKIQLSSAITKSIKDNLPKNTDLPMRTTSLNMLEDSKTDYENSERSLENNKLKKYFVKLFQSEEYNINTLDLLLTHKSEKQLVDTVAKTYYKYYLYLNQSQDIITNMDAAILSAPDGVEKESISQFRQLVYSKRETLLDYLKKQNLNLRNVLSAKGIASSVTSIKDFDYNNTPSEYLVNQELYNALVTEAAKSNIDITLTEISNIDFSTVLKEGDKNNKLRIPESAVNNQYDIIAKNNVLFQDIASIYGNKINKLFDLYNTQEQAIEGIASINDAISYGPEAKKQIIENDIYSSKFDKNIVQNYTAKMDLLAGLKENKFQEELIDRMFNMGTSSRSLKSSELIHWTDLGRYYSNFKLLFSDSILNSFNVSAADQISSSSFTDLVSMQAKLNVGTKFDNMQDVAGVASLAIAVKSVAKGVKGLMTKGETKGSNAGGFKGLWDAIQLIGGLYFAIYFTSIILPAFIWMFVILMYYLEMAMYVAIFPIGFLFMVFSTMRSQSIRSYVQMLLGFILLPVTLVSMYFIVLYLDIMLPVFFQQFMPYFNNAEDIRSSMQIALGESKSATTSVLATITPSGGGVFDSMMMIVGQIIYTILSMIMSVLLLMTFFKANDFMSKVLQVSSVGGGDYMQSERTMNKMHSLDSSGVTRGLLGN